MAKQVEGKKQALGHHRISGILLTGSIALLAAAGIALFAPMNITPARAYSSITVSTTLDESNPNDGKCSLREAATAARTLTSSGPAAGECPAGTGNDVVSLAAGTYTLTDAARGKIILDKNTIVTGAGSNATIVQGGLGWNDGIFQVWSTGNAEINELMIRGGHNPAYGGGIYVGGGRLTLISSVVQNNTATQGGGIANYQGWITVTNSTVQLNSATNGGGGIVAFSGTRTTVFYANVMTNTSTIGGGIYNYGLGSLDIESSQIISNTATTGDGGGILSDAGKLVKILATTIERNTALNGSGGGIALDNDSKVAAIQFSTISNNRAHYAAGIKNGPNETALTVDSSLISGNFSGDKGGGIFNSSRLTVTNSTIAFNVANPASLTGYGGGIYVYNTTILTNTTVSSNQAYQGGGILVAPHLLADELSANFTTIANNQAAAGGGIYVYGDPGVKLRNSLVATNRDSNTFPDCGGTPSSSVTSLGYNLIGNKYFCNYTAGWMDQIGSLASPIDPLLDPLSKNGGPTPTQGLYSGSPALNKIPAGINTCGLSVTADQRGHIRPASNMCDIGAFEGTIYRLDLPLLLR